jgi:hypothetical protein
MSLRDLIVVIATCVFLASGTIGGFFISTAAGFIALCLLTGLVIVAFAISEPAEDEHAQMFTILGNGEPFDAGEEV